MTLQKQDKSSIISDFGKDVRDTGSTAVQIALLTKDITELTVHCQQNPKDFSSRRGLINKVCKRKSLLRYLMRTDANKYQKLIDQLGIRK